MSRRVGELQPGRGVPPLIGAPQPGRRPDPGMRRARAGGAWSRGGVVPVIGRRQCGEWRGGSASAVVIGERRGPCVCRGELEMIGRRRCGERRGGLASVVATGERGSRFVCRPPLALVFCSWDAAMEPWRSRVVFRAGIEPVSPHPPVHTVASWDPLAELRRGVASNVVRCGERIELPVHGEPRVTHLALRGPRAFRSRGALPTSGVVQPGLRPGLSTETALGARPWRLAPPWCSPAGTPPRSGSAPCASRWRPMPSR